MNHYFISAVECSRRVGTMTDTVHTKTAAKVLKDTAAVQDQHFKSVEVTKKRKDYCEEKHQQRGERLRKGTVKSTGKRSKRKRRSVYV